MNNEPERVEGEITVSETGDVVIGAPAAIAIINIHNLEDEE